MKPVKISNFDLYLTDWVRYLNELKAEGKSAKHIKTMLLGTYAVWKLHYTQEIAADQIRRIAAQFNLI